MKLLTKYSFSKNRLIFFVHVDASLRSQAELHLNQAIENQYVSTIGFLYNSSGTIV